MIIVICNCSKNIFQWGLVKPTHRTLINTEESKHWKHQSPLLWSLHKDIYSPEMEWLLPSKGQLLRTEVVTFLWMVLLDYAHFNGGKIPLPS